MQDCFLEATGLFLELAENFTGKKKRMGPFRSLNGRLESSLGLLS
jgi:hypothetical protein